MRSDEVQGFDASTTSAGGPLNESHPKLGEVLVAAGALSQVQLFEALQRQSQERKRRRLGELLIETGAISESQLTLALSGQLRLSYAHLPTMALDYEVVHCIPRSLADLHQVIPIGISQDGAVLLAMADPTDVLARDDVRAASGCSVRPVCARPSHVAQAINRYYRF